MTVAVLPMGDEAFILRFDDHRGAAGARAVSALCEGLLAERAAGRLPGVLDLIPATETLTVCFDPACADFADLSARIVAFAAARPAADAADARRWRLPACYDPAFGPDLAAVAAETGLGVDAVIARHAEPVYTVLLIGFLPGFPYLGDLDPGLRLPRLASPRARAPAGSVAIAQNRTAIYPWESPGGWRLIGRCPVPLFDAAAPDPCLLRPGDGVRFAPVTAEDHARIAAALAAGTRAPADFREDGAAW